MMTMLTLPYGIFETAHVFNRKWLNKLWSKDTMNYYSETRMDDLRTHTITQMNLKNTMLRGKKALDKNYPLQDSVYMMF